MTNNLFFTLFIAVSSYSIILALLQLEALIGMLHLKTPAPHGIQLLPQPRGIKPQLQPRQSQPECALMTGSSHWRDVSSSTTQVGGGQCRSVVTESWSSREFDLAGGSGRV